MIEAINLNQNDNLSRQVGECKAYEAAGQIH